MPTTPITPSMHTIKRAAAVVGIAPATLRAWERRYGVVTPHRTESGYRLYDDAALSALSTMNSLVQQGWSPRQAADEVRRAAEASAVEAADSDNWDPTARAADPDQPPSPEGMDELLDAASVLDAPTVGRILDERLAVGRLEQVIDSWVMPALMQVGHAWASGRIDVAGEHLIAGALYRRLSAAYEAAGATQPGPRVIIGLPPGSRHDLGLLAFAVAARRSGLRTTYLGADLPVAAWVGAVEPGDFAVIAAPRRDDLPAVATVVRALRESVPGVTIGVGGQFQDRAPADCVRLGHLISAAPERLLAAGRPGD